jgi:dethiobiotin synthetase
VPQREVSNESNLQNGRHATDNRSGEAMNSGKLKHRGIFVTATDTSVGKTTVAAGLIGFLKRLGIDVGVMKPVATGAIECDSGKLISQDAEMLVKFSVSTDPWECVNPYCLATPVTPALAARIEGVTIDFGKLRLVCDDILKRHEFIVVEGAGGVMSPVFENRVTADLIKALSLPALIVARSGLGTINHTLMTYECLRLHEVPVLGFLLNRFPKKPNLAESTNAEIIASVSGLTYLGSIPEMGDFFSQQDLVDTFAQAVHRDQILEILFES